MFPGISYGAAIWATESYYCINAVQNRAAKYFLNVGRYTPNGDIGWTPVVMKCWKSILTFWCRTVNMDDNRLNKKDIVGRTVNPEIDVRIGISGSVNFW